MSRVSTRWVVALAMTAGCGMAGCYGPSCESACEKALIDCGLTSLNPGQEARAQVEACTQACRSDMDDPNGEEKAVGWIACVEEAPCESSTDGRDMCLDCQSAYYSGSVTGVSCQLGE